MKCERKITSNVYKYSPFIYIFIVGVDLLYESYSVSNWLEEVPFI